MARTYKLEVGGDTFRGSTASAQEQMEAMHIAIRTGLITSLSTEEVSDMALVVALGSISYEDYRKLESLIVEGKVNRDEDDVPVAPNLFRDRIHDYYLLTIKALRENVGPFWNLRRPGDAGEGQAEKS